jgi:TadE-like protein
LTTFLRHHDRAGRVSASGGSGEVLGWLGVRRPRVRALAARRAGRRRQRGAVAVEAALVTPLVLVMLIGIVEFSFALRDYVSVSSAVRTGIRTATTNGALVSGNGTCEAAGPDLVPPPCSPTNTPAFAQLAAQAIQQTGTAMPKDSIDYIFVYKANDKGYPGANGTTTMPGSIAACAASATPCVAYVWQDSRDRFRYAGGSWTANTVNACPTTADSLGIYMHATHKFVSRLFGASLALGDRTVMRFEPLPNTICGSGVRA